jgi:ubiquinone/menaquinone biosynthesis C-methylase UbiE
MMNKELPSGAARFSGSVPKHYDDWLGPLFFEPYAIEVASRIDPSKINTALELACGTGRVTNHLRKKLSTGAKLIASDLSEEMLAIAKKKLQGENIDWRVLDAAALPFENDSMDLIVCCFGYMFVPDRIKAYEEAYRVLRKNGMLLFTTWDEMRYNGASNVYRKAVKKYVGDSLPDSYKLPFSMHNAEDIRKDLASAGFKDIKIERSEKNSVSESAAHAAEALTQGGSIYNELMQRNPEWVKEIRKEVEKELGEKFGVAPMVAPMRALIGEARK